jgi:Flp pilus assembly protein TadD
MHTLAQELGFPRERIRFILDKAFDLLEAGDLDGALVLFNGLLALDPGDASIHAAFGSVLHEQGKLTDAETAYDTAIKLDGKTVLARVNRGELRCKRGDLGGLEDLRLAAGIESAVQKRAQVLLRRYAR